MSPKSLKLLTCSLKTMQSPGCKRNAADDCTLNCISTAEDAMNIKSVDVNKKFVRLVNTSADKVEYRNIYFSALKIFCRIIVAAA